MPRWTDLAKSWALPPAGCFWLAFAGFGLWMAGFAVLGPALAAPGLVALYLMSLPWTSRRLISRLDRYPALAADHLDAEVPTALVVLDAGRRIGAREYGGDALKPFTLERLAYAAWLRRLLRFPLVASGNGAGALMSTYMKQLFDVPVEWIESTSHDTWENARNTAELLSGVGIERIVLITHYWHMPRAMVAFARTPLEVVPAPLGFERRQDRWESGLLVFVPSAASFVRSYLAVHEGIGLWWYRRRR